MTRQTTSQNSPVLFIKNMVCDRCIKVVKEEIEKLGFPVLKIALGEVTVEEKPSRKDLDHISVVLQKNGFELLENKKAKLIEQIKLAVIEQIQSSNKMKENYSRFLSNKLGLDYSYLSGLFSSTENITIEQFIILQKIERVKELIMYNELSLSQIADLLGYSSTSHLSNQFKKITGLSPSYFKNLKENKRMTIDTVLKS